MDIYAKGQLSYLILNCLLDRDFYGLDIITEVKTRSNGRIELKKPSVYSNLTRMEKQGQVSSYMRSSDVGPNRKYYSITEKGRAYYYELKTEFDRNHFDVFRDYQDEDVRPVQEESSQKEVQQQEMQDDFFDFSTFNDSPVNESSPTEEVKQETIENAYQETHQEVNETMEQKTEDEKEEVSTIQDDAKFLKQEEPADYNKRIYDITKDFNKYRKKRSFAEDQIAIVEDEASLQEAEAKRQEHLENFKSALLANKGKFSNRMSEDEFNRATNPRPSTANNEDKEEKIAEESPVRDDGVFITETRENFYQTRKIEPPRLKVNPAPLPAPKRDSSIDPSHKEIISKIYAKSKGEVATNENVIKPQESLYDYEDLKDYYSSQNISFRVYQQSKNMAVHNTNKIELVLSLVSFALACIVSGVLFAILYATKYTLQTTDFLYIVLPLALLIDVAIKLFALKYTSWEPKPMLPQWLVWGLFVLSIGVVFGINFVFGMNPNDMLASATTLILPMALLLVLIPVRYYIKRFAYKAYWR